MVRNTTNHGWPVQEDGDEDYELTFDKLVNQIDEEVIIKDTLSNRPSAGTAGRWFLATDGPTLYHDDGTTWTIIGGRNVQFSEIQNVGTIAFDTSNQDMTIVDQFDQVQMRFSSGGQVRVPNGTFDVGNDIETIEGTTIWDSSNEYVPASNVEGLSMSSDTDMDVAGTSLTDSANNTTVWDATNVEIPQNNLGGPASSLNGYPLSNSDLSNSSISIAGNSVSLGGSAGISHGDLSSIGSSDHHTRYSDNEAQNAIGGSTPWSNSDLSNSSVTIAGNTVSLGGTASISHSDISNQSSDDHHQKYTDSEAQTAVDGSNIDIGGDADTVDGYDIQKNGSDGQGIINFKT